MGTEEEIDRLMQAAVDAGLEGLDFAQRFDYATIAREYNGIGPEYSNAALRNRATALFVLFEPAAVIHDLRFFMADGTRKAFNYANMEFHENCLKLADRAYPFWSWKRYRARAVAHALYDILRGPAGWQAWQDASAKSFANQ